MECGNGILKTGPLGLTLGKGDWANATFVWEFEVIETQIDAEKKIGSLQTVSGGRFNETGWERLRDSLQAIR